MELLLATGLRVSEAAALTFPKLLLTHRPPRIIVASSVHDPDCTKNGRPRRVPFRASYNMLPRRLLEWIGTRRDPHRLTPRLEVFLASREVGRGGGLPTPLTLWGFEALCQRVSV